MIMVTEPDSPQRPREVRTNAVSSQLPRNESDPIPERPPRAVPVPTILYSSSASSKPVEHESTAAATKPLSTAKLPNLPPHSVVPHRRKRNQDQQKLDQFVFPPRSNTAA